MYLNPSLNWERLESTFYRTRALQRISHTPKYVGHSLYLTVEQDKTTVYSYLDEEQLIVKHESLPGHHIKSVLEGDHLILVLNDRIRRYESLVSSEFIDFKISDDDGIPPSIWDYCNGLVITTNFKVFKILEDNQLFRDAKFSLLLKDHWFANDDEIIILDESGKVIIGDLGTGNLTEFDGWTGWYKGTISKKGYICLVNGKLNELLIFKDSLQKPLVTASLDQLPTNLAWCGDDIICCQFGPHEIRFIGSEQGYVSFLYLDEIFNIQTCHDGVKVITTNQIHFVSEVPECTSNIFRIGSTESSAILLDSLNVLENDGNSPKAIENLKIINVKKAVQECILAASDEIESVWQKRLLSAASFGKDSLSSSEFDSGFFVETCNKLKVLNFLQSMGIYLTMSEFNTIGIDQLLTMLINLRKIYECFQILALLKRPEKLSFVFQQWASQKILICPDLSDVNLYKQIHERASDFDLPLPMSAIASVAYREGRFRLARDLTLDDENVYSKISLLLKMDEINLSIQEANEYNETAVLSYLLLYFKKTLTNAQFTKLLVLTLQNNQLFSYIERSNFTFLFDYYRQTDDYLHLAKLLWEDGKKQGQTQSALLDQMIDLYAKISIDSEARSDQALFKRSQDLLQYQTALTIKFGFNFLGLTMDDTIIALIKNEQNREVNKMLKEFSISERKFYFLKCITLAKDRKLKELKAFALQKKPPIGFWPFYRAVRKYADKKEAAVYISLISTASYNEKLDMYLDCEAYAEAIKLASLEKDAIGLKQVLNKIPPNEAEVRSFGMQSLHNL